MPSKFGVKWNITKGKSKCKSDWFLLWQNHCTNTGAMHYILHAYDEPKVFRNTNKNFAIKMEDTENEDAAVGIQVRWHNIFTQNFVKTVLLHLRPSASPFLKITLTKEVALMNNWSQLKVNLYAYSFNVRSSFRLLIII